LDTYALPDNQYSFSRRSSSAVVDMRSSATPVTGVATRRMSARGSHILATYEIHAENFEILHHTAPELMRMTKSGTKPTQCTLDVWTSKLGKKRKKSDRDEDVGSF
jgi:hypothetical protein